MQNETPLPSLLEELRTSISEDRPNLNVWAVIAAMEAFLIFRNGTDSCPAPNVVASYLSHLVAQKGKASGQAEFAWLQIAAAYMWGPKETAFFATTLRIARVSEKTERATEWEKAKTAIASLPEDWWEPMVRVIERNKDRIRTRTGRSEWSASRIASIARAMARWHAYCQAQGRNVEPTGISLQDYAEVLQGQGVSVGSVYSYLEGIYSGYRAVAEGRFQSESCEFVIGEFKTKMAKCGNARAKPFVAATSLYTLGLQLMADARAAPVLNITSAITYRNGLMLALAAALPQRARALAALEFGVTIGLDTAPTLWIELPGSVLKMREKKKANNCFSRRFENERLWAALREYQDVFRPLFDCGAMLFPSKNAIGAGISEGQISRLIGNITEEHLGVRVSVHRVRDCVATEASEELENGALMATALLGHRDQTITQRHYDHSEGLRGAKAFAEMVERMKGEGGELLV